MEVLYKVSRWDHRESDIKEVQVTRQTDKTVWLMQGKNERKELKRSSYYRYFNTKAEAISMIESKNENARARKADELIKQSAPALLEALEELLDFSNIAAKEMTTVRGDYIDWCEKAKAAIAAARGK